MTSDKKGNASTLNPMDNPDPAIVVHLCKK